MNARWTFFGTNTQSITGGFFHQQASPWRLYSFDNLGKEKKLMIHLKLFCAYTLPCKASCFGILESGSFFDNVPYQSWLDIGSIGWRGKVSIDVSTRDYVWLRNATCTKLGQTKQCLQIFKSTFGLVFHWKQILDKEKPQLFICFWKVRQENGFCILILYLFIFFP